MNSKEYVMPDGKKAVFEYDHDGIGKVTIEAMDILMGLVADGRKRGEWASLHNGKWKCSECGIEVLIYAKGNFCPSCGCRMKGADDD